MRILRDYKFLGRGLPLPAAGRGLPDLRHLHQEVRRLRRGHAADRRRSACSCPRGPTSRSAASSSARCSASTPTAEGAKLHPGPLPRPDRHDPGERHRLDRAQDAVRREVRLARGARRPVVAATSSRAPRSSAPRSRSRSRRSSPTSTRCCAPSSRPAINQTLNAMATALEGRGDQIGQNLETVDSYLKRVNPQIPAIVDDLRLTAKVSDTYADVMPQIAQILRNTVKTTGTLEDRAGEAERALHRRHGVLRHRPRLPRRERRQHHPARPGRRSQQLRVLRQVLPGVPLPARGHRERRQAARPRPSAASPCTSCSRRCRTSRAATPRRDVPRLRRRPRAQLPAPAQPAVVASRTRSGTSRTSTTASTSPTGQGHRPGGARLRTRRRPTPAAARSRRC